MKMKMTVENLIKFLQTKYTTDHEFDIKQCLRKKATYVNNGTHYVQEIVIELVDRPATDEEIDRAVNYMKAMGVHVEE